MAFPGARIMVPAISLLASGVQTTFSFSMEFQGSQGFIQHDDTQSMGLFQQRALFVRYRGPPLCLVAHKLYSQTTHHVTLRTRIGMFSSHSAAPRVGRSLMLLRRLEV